MSRSHIPSSESGASTGTSVRGVPITANLEDSWKEIDMREWPKPTIEETESGMEVTSYLPAELDRA